MDRVITVDAHLHRTPDIADVFPGIEAENLSAMPAIASALTRSGVDPATVVIGPDAESRRGSAISPAGWDCHTRWRKRCAAMIVRCKSSLPILI